MLRRDVEDGFARAVARRRLEHTPLPAIIYRQLIALLSFIFSPSRRLRRRAR